MRCFAYFGTLTVPNLCHLPLTPRFFAGTIRKAAAFLNLLTGSCVENGTTTHLLGHRVHELSRS